MASVKIDLVTPKVPNFIFLHGTPKTRQEGFKESPKVSLGELDDETLRQIGDEWTQALLKRAQEQRDQK